MNRTTIALATGLALGGLPALAQDALPVQDTNADGVYSLEEIQAAVPDLTAETYASVDTNADGGVDAAELAAAIEVGTIKPAT
ncbi:MAG: EF-hand domain-containing protein [Gemmobacter sp.]